MRRLLIPVVALVALAAPAARADVKFSATKAEVGEVKSGAPLVRRFEMVNDGPTPVKVLEVRVGCGCVKPKFDPPADSLPFTLAVGEKRAVVLEVNTLSQAEGDQSWTATVIWEAGDEVRDERLVIHGKVITEVSVQPATLFIFTDAAIRHDVTLTDRRPQPLTVNDVHLATPHVKAHLRPAAPTGRFRTFRVELEVSAECPEGRYTDTLCILTNDPVYGEVKVPVTVVKRGKQFLKTSPESVWVQAAAGQAVPSKLLRVYDSSGRPVKVDGVTTEDPAVTATFAQGHDGSATVKVMIDRSKVSGTRLITGLRIEVSEPEKTTLTLPVTCILE